MGLVKAECAHARTFESREQAALEIFEYIECFYNRVRMHSALGHLSPEELEAKNRKGPRGRGGARADADRGGGQGRPRGLLRDPDVHGFPREHWRRIKTNNATERSTARSAGGPAWWTPSPTADRPSCSSPRGSSTSRRANGAPTATWT